MLLCKYKEFGITLMGTLTVFILESTFSLLSFGFLTWKNITMASAFCHRKLMVLLMTAETYYTSSFFVLIYSNMSTLPMLYTSNALFYTSEDSIVEYSSFMTSKVYPSTLFNAFMTRLLDATLSCRNLLKFLDKNKYEVEAKRCSLAIRKLVIWSYESKKRDKTR